MTLHIDYSQFSPEDQVRMRSAAFGIEVAAFTHTLIGQYLLERASQQRAQALEQLAVVTASDFEAVRELQSAVRRSDSFQAWLEDAVMAGENAETELRTEASDT